MHESDLHEVGTLKIGAVARLTGVSTHTLRKWEDRYDTVVPGRTPRGQRVYTGHDVERLLLIKRLVDAGVAPRDVASMSLDDLSRKSKHLAEVEGAANSAGLAPLRVAVIGSAVRGLLERQVSKAEALELVVSVNSAAELDEAHVAAPIDLVVCECDSVRDDTRQMIDALIERLDAQAAVLVYRFSARGDLLALQAPHLATLRAPTDRRTLEQIAVELMRPLAEALNDDKSPSHDAHTPLDAPPPRISRDTIGKIARITPRLQCECPLHLADILLGLRAFEDYSASCESRNPQDAALHQYLWRSAAQARALFEDAIEHVAAAEGISIAD